jgi:hypothetical protein
MSHAELGEKCLTEAGRFKRATGRKNKGVARLDKINMRGYADRSSLPNTAFEAAFVTYDCRRNEAARAADAAREANTIDPR